MASDMLYCGTMNNATVHTRESDCLTRDFLPSDISTVQLKVNGVYIDVLIPQREIFRVKEIFQNQGYAVPYFMRDPEKAVIVDIGANVGLFALYMGFILPDAEIHCYEPAPASLELLKRNISGKPRVRIHPYGLSDKKATLPFYIHSINTGMNSYRPSSDTNIRGMIQSEVAHAGEEFDKRGFGHVDILKIDTEGSEVNILAALEPYLPLVHYVLLEYHSEKDRRQIESLLHSFTLISSKSAHINRGVNKYINNEWLPRLKTTISPAA
jgi:FkbM family methyltransferase